MNIVTILLFIALACDVALGRKQSRKRRQNTSCRIPTFNFPLGQYKITPQASNLSQPVALKTKIRYKCNPGFKLKGPREIRCTKWGWKPRVTPRCYAESCMNPASIKVENGRLRGRRKPRVGDTAELECDKGYTVVDDIKITCKVNGQWSTIPECVKGCTDPGLLQVENGNIYGGHKSDVGDWVKLICNKGYKVIGGGDITCMRNGKWNPVPKCTKEDSPRDLKVIAKRMKENFVNKFGLVTKDSRGRAGLSGGAAGLDLVFVLDNSRSVGKTNFGKGKTFVKEMIKSFGVSRHKLGTRVAVLSFHKDAFLLLSLDDKSLNSTQAAMDKLDKEVQFMGGGTHTKNALRKVINDVVPTCRKKSKKALFLITDGESNTNQEPGDLAQQLREKHHFECFAIGISSEADEKQLNSVASEPFRNHVFMLNNFDNLRELTLLINGSKTDYEQCGIAGDTQTRLNASAGRIVGGISAKPGAWPWQAMILIDGTFQCSGSLLNEKWVVTAAHCFHGGVTADRVDVRLGEHDRGLEEGPEMDEFVSQLIPHKDNKEDSYDYDIALLRLEAPVKLTAFVRPVCLPDSDGDLKVPRKIGIVTGWGATDQVNEFEQAGPSSRVLNQVAVPFVHQKECERSSPQHLPITGNMICAGTGIGDVDACQGDSGGPLVARRSRDEWVLMGIVSWGEGCARQGKYGVYTDVTTFVDWISSTMGSDI